jgi:uncharacterized protein (TIGR03000 family)
MLRIFIGFALSIGGIAAPTPSLAGDGEFCGPWAASAAFPLANPPGWYTNTYSYPWYYPWYAYYNSSQGPYANWMAGRGFASYGNHKPTFPALPAEVTIQLPAEAKLSFSGVAAKGTGSVRSFTTPALEANQEYGYEMTAELAKDGQILTATKLVIVHAGENVKVNFQLSELKALTPQPGKK